jgi:flagellar hook assembly protein FlgD/fibronectin type 3 domain-containing protein/subtilase family serine protease
MRCKSVIAIFLCLSIFFLSVFVSFARTADFTVVPLENTSDIAVYEVTGDYDAEMYDGSNNVISRQKIAREFYKTHPDDYDFLIVFSNFDFQMPEGEAVAFYQGVKNDVEGIGIELVDNTYLYGSNGVLQGTIDMGNIHSIVSDPFEPGFSDTMGLLSHELLHRWAAKVTFRGDDNSISSELLGMSGYHWSFLLDTAGSLEYGNRWVNNGNGTFTSLAGRRYFSPLDMYLMGLIGKSEVPPMLLINNPEIDPERLPEPGITIEGISQHVSIDDIIAAEGERIPSAVDAQKSFRIGSIFITRPGTYLETDLYEIRSIMQSWSMWFSGLTNGLGKVNVDNAPLPDLPENPGPVTPPIDPRTAPPEINEGVAWLLNNQKEDGSWLDSSLTVHRDTAEVLAAIAGYATAANAFAEGVSWLENTDTRNTDYLARKIGMLSSSGFNVAGLSAELLKMQNPDGGWGSSSKYGSNPSDTALALRALSTAGEASEQIIGSAIHYLLSEQNGDSGWGIEGLSTIQTSIDVLTAFLPFKAQYQLDVPLQNGLSWVYSKQNSDGGFGNSPSTIYGTAKALIGLKQIGITSQVTDQALSYILDRQELNGSWLSSVYQTSLAVNAIWIAMRIPDLSVTTAEIVPSPDTITSLPSDISLSITVHNSGMFDVPEVKVVLYEGAVSDSSRIGEVAVGISGENSETVVFHTTITHGSPHHYYVVVDPDNLIPESSEQNNSALRIIYSDPTYDFAISPEGISVTPATGNIFESLTVSTKGKNNGTVDAFSVPLHLVADNGSGPMIVASKTIDLPAGQSVDVSFSWIPEISGVGLLLSMVLDPYGAFAETVEENNSAAVVVDINPSTKADLSLSYSDISFNPVPALEAGTTSLQARVLNRGFSSATDVEVDFYDGVVGEDGNVLLGSVVIPVIAAGESVGVVQTWENIPVFGERVITVVVDPENAIDEITESNNSGFGILRVLTLPDLEISDKTISFTPEGPKEGDSVTVSAIVRNRGEQPVANIPVAFHKGSALLGTSILPQIEANSQAAASVTFESNESGIIRIEVVVDPDKTIHEQDTGNNRAARNIGVQNGDLWLSESFISPNGDGVKDSTDFGYRLEVPQDVTVVVVNEEGEAVKKYSGSDLQDTLFVSLTWDGLENKGRVVDDGQYRIQVLSESGSVLSSLLVVVDTNRSSLLKALGTPYLYTTKIEYLLKDYKYNWFSDDSGVVFHLESKKPELPEYETGIYTASTVGGQVTRLVPEEWSEDVDAEIGYRYLSNKSDCNLLLFECDQINPGFALSADGSIVAFILEKYNKSTRDVIQQQLWSVNRYGEGLTLLDSFDYQEGDPYLITDIFPSPDGSHIAYKLYDQNAAHHFFSIIFTDGTGKITFTPERNSGFDYQHRLNWAPDSQKLVFSDDTHAIVADLAGNMQEVMQLANPTVFFDWYGSNRILVRDIQTSGRDIINSWVVDLNTQESPLLIAEELQLPYSPWYEFGGCIKNGSNYIFSKTPLLDNGHFIAGYEWKDGNIVNYIVCDLEGNCQDSDLIDMWMLSPSLTPDAGKIVVNETEGAVEIFDRETLEIEFFKLGYRGCENYLEDRYNIPSHYKIWPPTERDCAERSFLIVPKWNWLDNETFLAWYIGEQHNIIAFNIESGERTFLLEERYFGRLALSPGKRSLSFLGDYNEETRRYDQFTILGSLLNLTADLRSGKTESAVNFQGTATDLNFSHWTLEYADQKTPDDWRIITPPVENPVVNGLLATWIPPYEGSFLVRLAVTDQAGNTAWDRRRVTWGKKFSVTNIYKTGEMFSPNADGVKDTAGLNYFVQEPVHLDLYVYDQEGSLLRIFSRDHALPGEYGIAWDGKDESGGIVPDGYYTIKIFDYEFFFQVDTTPPDARLEFSSVYCGEIPVLRSSLSGLALDKNLKSWALYYGVGESPQEWYEYQSSEAPLVSTDLNDDILLDESGNPLMEMIRNFTPYTSPSTGFLGNTIYRIIVEDFAGNQSVVGAQFNKELVVFSQWDEYRIVLEVNEQGVCNSPALLPINLLDFTTHNLTIIETLRKSISSATVQYRMHMQWQDAEEIIDPPENEINFIFDTSSLVPEDIAAVRVKIVDVAGVEYYTDSVVFNPPEFEASMGCIPIGSMSPGFIGLKSLLPEGLETITLQATSTVAGVAEWEGLREYREEVLAAYYNVTNHMYSFAAPSLPQEYEYPLRFFGIGESGKKYISDELPIPPQQCKSGGSDGDGSSGGGGGDQCVSKLLVSYDQENESCNSVNGIATIAVYLCLDDVPQVLPDKVNYYLEENGEWRFLKQFDPVIDGWGKVTLDTAGLQDGEYPVKVDFVYGETVQSEVMGNTLIVDRTLPVAKITYPSPSVPFCARTFENGDGVVSRYVDIAGSAADGNGSRRYSIAYGQGSDPDKWVDIEEIFCDPQKHNCIFIGHLGTWNVTNLESLEYSLRLMVTDNYGNTSCFVTQTSVVDSDMSLAATVDRPIFSPNADGVKDEVSLEYQVGEYAVLDIMVLDEENAIIRSLVSAQEITAGSGTISWDGRNGSGATVPDGNYEIHIEARDSCGNLWHKMFPVTVDNTPPIAMISFPGTGEALDIITEVTGTANDMHLFLYQLHAHDEAGGTEPLLLGAGDIFVEDDILGTWNTFGLEGNWALVLSVEDLAGNTRTTSLPVSFGTRPQLISKLEADPNIFSPNGDGKLDKTTVTYELTDRADVTIAVEDISGNILLSDGNTNVLSGSHQYQWDGLAADGEPVGDGNYKLKVTAESITAPFVAQVEAITLTIDTTSPTIDVTVPEDSSYYPGVVKVRGALSDRNLQEFSVTLSGGQDTLLFDTVVISNEIVFSRSLDLVDGVYVVQVDARDSVSNINSETVSFTVDKTRPRITLESPVEDDFFGGSQLEISVKGIIEEVNLQSYTVQYGSGVNPTEWIDLTSGEELPSGSLLATWAVGPDQAVADGDYIIRVTAVDKAGWESVAEVRINVDNNAPELDVVVPEEGAFVKEPFDITGTVNDPFLKEYTLKIADSTCASAVNWSVLRNGTESIEDGILSSMKALPPDGVYCVHLSAVDSLDKSSAKEVNFTIDTAPLAAPVLSGKLEGDTGIFLEWQGNTEPDLAGYDLYRNNEKVNSLLITETDFLDQDLTEEEYRYTVRAVDLAGLVSEDSNQVVFTVDLTPPEAMIHSPRDGFLLSNYADVIGRAYSKNDFKEYRLSYGMGESPQTWQLLRNSPVPVSYGTLARWDVISLDDGFYSIRLEAEDLNGNVNEKIVSVTIDNTPPEAPVLLTVTPDGATVDLTWQANVEPDLAGYLVYRNGQLANGSGTVIGDLSPYLITGLTYQNIDVPDGTHGYYLVAMDSAGNMSDQSNTVQVELDTHAPHLTLISPAPGLEFDTPIIVKAESDDTDIDTVRFQYQSISETVWEDLGSILTRRPYVVALDPALLDWEFGAYRLRAIATDFGGLIDGGPEEVAVQFKDITPPGAPRGGIARMTGGSITLSWDGNREADLAGYNVYLGENSVKKNSVLLSDTIFMDPAEFFEGEYLFKITAVDTAGNESEKAPVTATVFRPLMSQSPTPVSVSDIPMGGSTVPGATVEIFRNLTSEVESLGITQADGNGLFTFATSLIEGGNSLYGVAIDPAGNVSLSSNTISVFYDMAPAPPANLTSELADQDVNLSWDGNTEPDLAGYIIYRKTTTDWQKINPSLLTTNSHIDSNLKNDTYIYRVTAVDNGGGESGPSNESSAEITRQLPAPPLNLTATAPPDGGMIDVCWEESVDSVEGYLVYRSLASGGPYVPASSSLVRGSCYHDPGLTNGTEYYYIVRAVDSYENESSDSNEDSAVPRDTVSQKPLLLLPTISGRPYHSPAEKVDVGGLSEAGAHVDLLHDQVWIDTVQALMGSVHEKTFLTDARMYDTVVTHDGNTAFSLQKVTTSSPYQYYTFRKDLENDVETRIDSIPEGSWEHKISPDGTKIVYNYADAAGWVKIGIYDLATDTAIPLSSPADVDDWEPAWSGDGMKIVFDSDRGDGFYDIWMYDVISGEISRVTRSSDGAYPEISADGDKISFLAWDSDNRENNLYLVDSMGGDPILLVEDVDWSGYYPSMEWSPRANKLAFTANRDGAYDIYILDTDTEEILRLTDTESTEASLQWSPDGKYLSYYIEFDTDTEVRMVSTDGQGGEKFLYSFEGRVEQNFNWLPAGIFYRVGSDLHRIIPPGTFLFEDVGLHPGENVFSATAEDAAGNVSDPAEEIVVAIDAEEMPDLEVQDQDIFILPSVPLAGEEATFSVMVRNRSSVAAENVYAEIYTRDARNNIELIHSETISYLDQHSEEWLSVNGDSTGMVGLNTLYVLLDPHDEIAESLEDNNLASSHFYVAEEEGLFFKTSLNGSEFSSDEFVAIDVDIHNSGVERDVHLTVVVEDENGDLVEGLADMDKMLAYGGNEKVELSWRAGSVFAGQYQVRTVLVDSLGEFTGEQVVAFTVLPDTNVYTSLTSNKLEYGPDENALFDLSVANRGANTILPELRVTFTILNNGLVHHVEEHTLLNLYPADRASIDTSWNTVHNAPGNYTAVVEIFMDNQIVAESATEFVILPAMEISGTVSVDPKLVLQDGGVEVDFSVTGRGNREAGVLLLKLLVLDTSTWTTVSSHEQSMSLGMNETVSGQHEFAGLGLDIGMYQVLLQAVHQNDTRSLAGDSFQVRDGVAPVVSVLSPADGTVVADSVDLSVTAIDGGAGVAKVEYQLDSGTWLPLAMVNSATGRYAARWLPDEADEGPHTVSFRATDLAGNISIPVDVDVTIEMCNELENLAGSLNITPEMPYCGQDVVLEYTLTNQCNKPLDDLGVKVLIQNPVTNTIVETLQTTIALEQGGEFSGIFTIPTTTIEPSAYTAILQVVPAGQSISQTLDSGVFAVVARQYTLQTRKTGSGRGTISSSPAGIQCDRDCEEDTHVYEQDTIVTLTATPDLGSSFTGWSDKSCSGSHDCVITMDQARSLSVTFNAFPWHLFRSAFFAKRCKPLPDYCYLVADGDNEGSVNSPLFKYTFATAELRLLNRLGVDDVEAIVLSLDGKILYGADNGVLGIINPIEGRAGSFRAIDPAGVGTGQGELGAIVMDDIDGLSFDPTTRILYGSVRYGWRIIGVDLLIQLNPETGRLIEDGFGAGIDYVVINSAFVNAGDIDDIAIDSNGILYGVANNNGAGDHLVIIDKLTGEVTDQGPLSQQGNPVQDMEGMTLYNNTTLCGTTGMRFADQSTHDTMYVIEKETGKAEAMIPLDQDFDGYLPHDFEAISCFPICK